MAESVEMSGKHGTGPSECDTVKKEPSGITNGQRVPAAIPCGLSTTFQLQGQTCVVNFEEKVDMVRKMNCEIEEIFILMHSVIEGKSTVVTAEPCMASLSGTEFPTTCEVILKWLHHLLRFFPSTDSQLKNRIRKTLEHLIDNDFLISVFGRFNSGKSTLLNAVLANKCLPVSEQNETRVVVKIAHSGDVHPGCCKDCSHVQTCPLLEESNLMETNGHTPVLPDTPTIGAQNICKVLKTIDERVKKKELKVTSQLTIKAHVPAIAKVQEPWKVFLVDNPGFSADDDGINSLAQTAMETSHAYVLTLDYSTIEDDRNAKTFRDIFSKDKSVFDDKLSRLVIVVTRLDAHYRNVDEDEQLRLPVLRKKAVDLVCEKVHSAVGVHISGAKVVPVFGMWALNARQLKYLQDNKQLLKRAKKNLENFFTGPSGEGQEVAADISPSDVVEILERESGIRQLEEEIQHMADACGSGWIRSVHGDCSSYVGATLTVLRDKISLLHRVLTAQEEKYEHNLKRQQNIVHIQQEFEQNLKEDEDGSNPVVQQLTECYLQDVKDVSKRTKEELAAFEKQCKDKFVGGQIPTQSFESDLQKLLAKLKKLIDEQGFKNIYENLELLREDVIQKKASLQSSSREYCRLGSSRPSIYSKVKGTVSSLATLVGIKGRDIVDHRPNLQQIQRKIHPNSHADDMCRSYTFDEERTENSLLKKSYQDVQHKQSFSFSSLLESIKRALAWWNELLGHRPVEKPADADTSLRLSSRTQTTSAQTKGTAESEATADESLSGPELEELFQKLQCEVEEGFYRYFDEIQQEIINFFFKHGYCEYVVDGLEDFSKQFTEAVERQDKEMKVMGVVLREMHLEADVLKKWCDNLIHLQTLLYQQTGVYYQKCFQGSQVEVAMAGLTESLATAGTEVLTSLGLPVTETNFQTLNTTHKILCISDASQQDEKVQHRTKHHPGNTGLYISNHSEALKGRAKIYLNCKLERGERRQDIECSDFHKDFKEDVLSTCEATAVRLRTFSGKYPGLLAVFSVHLMHLWEQVDKKRISIALFGHLGSGKSMLLNAILTDSILPIGKTVKTVEVRIRNKSQVHKGQCPQMKDADCKTACSQCPELLELKGSKITEGRRIKGASNIAKKLHDIDGLMDAHEDDVKPIFIVEAYGPILDAACISPWKVHLVENAGYKDLTSLKEITRFTREVKAANAYIFTLPYTERKNDVHYQLLKKLIESDESVFRENRLTIVITHFEKWYTDAAHHQHPTVEEVKDEICYRLKDKVGACDVRKECLIPVCGEWANTARKLQSMPPNHEPSSSFEQFAMEYWKLYSGSDVNEPLMSVEIASKLLAASGIKLMEQRVMTMAATCSEDAVTMLSSNFDRYLKEAADSLDAYSTVLKEFYTEKKSAYTAFTTCYHEVTTQREQLRAKGNPEHILKNVQCSENMMEIGMEKCQKILAQNSQVLEQDLPGLQKVLNMELNDSTMFQSAWDVCCSHSTDVSKKLECIQETAFHVYPHPTQYSKALTTLNAKEFVERILQSAGSFKISENIKSKISKLGDLTEQLKVCISEDFRCHMQILAQCTLQHMQEWCSGVQTTIQAFESGFGQILDQRFDEHKTLMSEIPKWSCEAQKIEECRDHLRRLKEYLEEKAKDCRMQLKSRQ